MVKISLPLTFTSNSYTSWWELSSTTFKMSESEVLTKQHTPQLIGAQIHHNSAHSHNNITDKLNKKTDILMKTQKKMKKSVTCMK